MTKPILPSHIDEHVGRFDRFAGCASSVVSRAPFFAFCVLLIVVWLPSYFVLRDVDIWQLIINTVTTCVTFLLVALLENSQYRADAAVQHKLNAIADALATAMAQDPALAVDVAELRAAVGLETRESSTD